MIYPTYELFYWTGGHGGPYTGYETAKDRAIQLLQGSASELVISIHPRDIHGIAGYLPEVGRVWKGSGREQGMIFHQYLHYPAHQVVAQ